LHTQNHAMYGALDPFLCILATELDVNTCSEDARARYGPMILSSASRQETLLRAA